MNSGYQRPTEIYANTIEKESKPSANNQLFPKSIQKLVNLYAFFVAFPFLDVFGNSVTFYIFIALLFRTGQIWLKSFPYKILFTGFMVACIISMFNAPETDRDTGMLKDLLSLVQLTYWVLVAFFFILYYKKINWYQTCKYILFGTISLTFCYFAFRLAPTGGPVSLGLVFNKNGYVFNVISTLPISLFYLYHRFKGKYLLLFIIGFILAVLLTEGRSGSIIIIIQSMLIWLIFRPHYRKYVFAFVIAVSAIFVYIQTDSSKEIVRSLAAQVAKVNPRLALLMIGSGEGDLTMDKSWLERKLLVDKGKEIIKDYPVFGIGFGHFKYYDASITSFYSYSRLHKYNLDYFNSRSAHNSYIMVLAETGFLGFSFFILMIAIPVIFFFRAILYEKITLYHLPLISVVGIAIHFYVIVAITGALAWMVLGVAYGAMLMAKRKK